MRWGRVARASMWAGLLVGCVSVVSCDAPVADRRAQLVVIIDTDAIVQGLVLDGTVVSRDAAIDSIRVDAIPTDGSNTAYDLRTFIAPSAADWPLSFGVASTEASFDGPVRLRVRAFAGRFARSGELAGEATLDPPPTLTIDRLIDVEPPRDGVHLVKVVLRADCLGVPTYFTDPPTTCIDAETLRGAPSLGVAEAEPDDTLESEVGSWPRAVETPCSLAAPAGVDAVCIAGGFSVLGHPDMVGLDEGFLSAAPMRPVYLSPFHLDRTEVSVGAFRAWYEAGAPQEVIEPCRRGDSSCLDSFSEFCSWLGVGDVTNDALPLNCVSFPTALAFCQAQGGTLPTEARWEHAARGRGRGSLHPWGDEDPSCCLASVSREGPEEVGTLCTGQGIEPVGSHPASDACGGLGDESIDGVLDLAGSLVEAVLDAPLPYDAECWLPTDGGGILTDPVCVQDSLDRTARGGYWNGGTFGTASPLRGPFGNGPSAGFRCAYEGSP